MSCQEWLNGFHGTDLLYSEILGCANFRAEVRGRSTSGQVSDVQAALSGGWELKMGKKIARTALLSALVGNLQA